MALEFSHGFGYLEKIFVSPHFVIIINTRRARVLRIGQRITAPLAIGHLTPSLLRTIVIRANHKHRQAWANTKTGQNIDIGNTKYMMTRAFVSGSLCCWGLLLLYILTQTLSELERNLLRFQPRYFSIQHPLRCTSTFYLVIHRWYQSTLLSHSRWRSVETCDQLWKHHIQAPMSWERPTSKQV